MLHRDGRFWDDSLLELEGGDQLLQVLLHGLLLLLDLSRSLLENVGELCDLVMRVVPLRLDGLQGLGQAIVAQHLLLVLVVQRLIRVLQNVELQLQSLVFCLIPFLRCHLLLLNLDVYFLSLYYAFQSLNLNLVV